MDEEKTKQYVSEILGMTKMEEIFATKDIHMITDNRPAEFNSNCKAAIFTVTSSKLARELV